MKSEIIRSKGGTKERKVTLDQIRVPDLWHIAHNQPDKESKETILECWRLAHDMLRTLREDCGAVPELLAALRDAVETESAWLSDFGMRLSPASQAALRVKIKRQLAAIAKAERNKQ